MTEEQASTIIEEIQHTNFLLDGIGYSLSQIFFLIIAIGAIYGIAKIIFWVMRPYLNN